jgi:DNA-binding Xre family transcriptional regulator
MKKVLRIYFNTIGAICKVLSVQVGDLFEYVETEEKKVKETKPKRGGKKNVSK